MLGDLPLYTIIAHGGLIGTRTPLVRRYLVIKVIPTFFNNLI